MITPSNYPAYQEAVKFHGHSCPGLAIGYRMAVAALDYFRDQKAEDEELVAIVENDACGTDAVQFVTGCTFGKGNLIFRDYGKMVYTFYHRQSGKAVRINRKTDFKKKTEEMEMSREEMISLILTTPQEDLLEIRAVNLKPPVYARLHNNVTCHLCGETVAEPRAEHRNGKYYCIPCYKLIKTRETKT